MSTPAIYQQQTYTIPANQFVRLVGDWDYFLLLSATDPNNIQIAFNNDGYQPLTYGLAIGGLRGLRVTEIRLKDTSGAPNTVVVSTGGASISLATANALPPGASTAALQTTGNASLASIDAKLTAPIDVEGPGAAGAAVSGKPVRIGASDGANTRDILSDAGGRLIAVGAVAAGSAIGTTSPVLMGGSDGTNVQRVKVDTNGNIVAVGAVAAGSAIGTTAPVLQGVSDGTNVQRMKGSTTGAVFVAGEAAHSAASIGNPVRVGGRVATAVDTTLVAGDAADLQVASSGAVVVQANAPPEVTWQYAAPASGTIVNSTVAVAIKAAAAAGVRNYLTAISVETDTLTTASELLILDGATVIWRGKLQVGATRFALTFPQALRGSAATALNVQTLTATGAALGVYVNAQGYTAP